MRAFRAVFRYELLMQVKSLRFKAVCGLAVFLQWVAYMEGIRRLELNPFRTFLDPEGLPLALVPIVFAGVFPVARLERRSVRTLLMVKPFHTFTLFLGQHLAALASLVPPLLLLMFPTGLYLRWRYGIEYPLPPLFYVLLFYALPASATVIAVTLWIRTCFKHNLIAMVVMGFIFFATAVLANSPWLNYRDPSSGERMHNFIPMVSYFSEQFWRRVADMPPESIRFSAAADWTNLALSMVYCVVFLLLACYHLRRTEPQRKVLGTYGTQWHHTPTFLKLFCDLRMDPHVTWRTHVALVLFCAAIGSKTVWPLLRPQWNNWMVEAKAYLAPTPDAPKSKVDPYDINLWSNDRVLPVKVTAEDYVFEYPKYRARITCEIVEDTSGRIALLAPATPTHLQVQQMSCDGKALEFVDRGYVFIEGSQLRPFQDGKPHVLEYSGFLPPGQSGRYSDVGIFSGVFSQVNMGRGLSVYEDGRGNTHKSAWWDRPDPRPIRMELVPPPGFHFAAGPVPPATRAEGDSVRYVFSASEDNPGAAFHSFWFYDSSRVRLVDLPGDLLHVRFLVDPALEATLREMLALSVPMLEEYCLPRGMATREPILVYRFLVSPDILRQLRKRHALYQDRGWIRSDQKRDFVQDVNNWQQTLLRDVNQRAGISGLWDLGNFEVYSDNLLRGLNHRIVSEGNRFSREYTPSRGYRDPIFMRQLVARPRVSFLGRGQIPVFQMLYLVLGHEPWMAMMHDLRSSGAVMDATRVQSAAESVAGEPMNWFFDYWVKDGTGLPAYSIERAVARAVRSETGETDEYISEITVRNYGTGRMPVPVVLETYSEGLTGSLWIGPGEIATWTVRSHALPRAAHVDMQQWILSTDWRTDESGRSSGVMRRLPVKLLKGPET